MSEICQLVHDVADLLSVKGRWTQGTQGITDTGRIISPLNSLAVKYCLIGATHKVLAERLGIAAPKDPNMIVPRELASHPLRDQLLELFNNTMPTSMLCRCDVFSDDKDRIILANDSSETNYADIIQWLDNAKERCYEFGNANI